MKWGFSVLDWCSHAIDECRDHPIGVFKAECGHRLMMATTLLDRPYSTPCEACAALQLARAVIPCQHDQISGRPPVEPPHRAPRGRPVPTSEGAGPMAKGKHRLAWRQAPAAPRRTVDMVDMRTLVWHSLTLDAAAAGRGPQGRYIALCGEQIHPAALVEPGVGYCLPCRSCRVLIPTQRSGDSR